MKTKRARFIIALIVLTLVAATAGIYLYSIQEKPLFKNGSVYENKFYSMQLKEGWSVEEYHNHGFADYLYSGKKQAFINIWGIKRGSNSMLIGMHNDLISEEDIPIEDSDATLNRVVSRWWLSAAQEIKGEEQPPDETHYFYRSGNHFVIQVTMEQGVEDTADIEEMLKTIRVKENSKEYHALEELAEADAALWEED